MYRISYVYVIIVLSILVSSCSVERSEAELLNRVNQNVAKTITIKKDIDLKGKTVFFPKGCSIVFKEGSLSNAFLRFEENAVKGNVKFINCQYSGTIKTKRIDDRNYTSIDDKSTLMFLLNNAIKNGASCDFYRDYSVNMNDVPSSGFIYASNINSGAEIDFHDHAVYNTTAFSSSQIKPVMVFLDVKNVTIRNCLFHDIDDHHTRYFARSSGCTFIQCYGDCEGINLLNCRQENGDCILRSGVYNHDNHNPELTSKLGLSKSTIIVTAQNVGYGLALYCGDKLDIDLSVTNTHRGFYCAGVSNSTIKYKGFNPSETKCHILLKDAVYRKEVRSGREELDMKGCHDLSINICIEELLPQEDVVVLHSYGSGKKENADFTFRSGMCHHYNIDITAQINKLPNDSYFFLCRCASDSGAINENDIYGCKVSNIIIHDTDITGCSGNYLCRVGPNVEANIEVKDCGEAHDLNANSKGFLLQVVGNATGKILVRNGAVETVYVQDKSEGQFDIELDNAPIIQGLNYRGARNTKKELVRISQ